MTKIWYLSKLNFGLALERYALEEIESNRRFLDKFSFLKNGLDNDEKDNLAATVKQLVYEPDEIIFDVGEPGAAAFVIKSGSVELKSSTGATQVLTKGDKFGDNSLFYNTVRMCQAKAKERTIALVVGREHLTILKNIDTQKHFLNVYVKTLLEQIAILKELRKADFEFLISCGTLQYQQSGHILIEEGAPVEFLFILVEGSLKALEDNRVILEKPGVWGDFRIGEDLGDKKVAEETIIFAQDSVLMKIPMKTINDKVGMTNKILKDATLQQNSDSDRVKLTSVRYADFVACARLNENKLYRYEVGFFRDMKASYLLKVFNKPQLESRKLGKYYQFEKRCLGDSSCPFVASFLHNFSEEEHHVFILKDTNGTTLYEVIRTIGLLNSFDCQFYTASMLIVLEALRDNKFVHRDLKPENFLVDPEGYLHLFDCSIVKYMSAERTSTIIGTPHYMAPEVVTGKEYSYEVDLWSVGICLYEFICGKVPFGDDHEDPFHIFEEILEGDLVFPNTINDSKLINLATLLLDPSQKNREKMAPQWLLSHSSFDKIDLGVLKLMQVNQVPYNATRRELSREKPLKKASPFDLTRHKM